MEFLNKIKDVLVEFDPKIYALVKESLKTEEFIRTNKEDLQGFVRILYRGVQKVMNPEHLDVLFFDDKGPKSLRWQVSYILFVKSAEKVEDLPRSEREASIFLQYMADLMATCSQKYFRMPLRLQKMLTAVYSTGLTAKDVIDAPQVKKLAATKMSPEVGLVILYCMVVRTNKYFEEWEYQEITLAIFQSIQEHLEDLQTATEYFWTGMGLKMLLAKRESSENPTLVVGNLGATVAEKYSITGPVTEESFRQLAKEYALSRGLSTMSVLDYMRVAQGYQLLKAMPMVVSAIMQWDDSLNREGMMSAVMVPVYQDYCKGKKTVAIIQTKKLAIDDNFSYTDYDDKVTDHCTVTGHAYSVLWLFEKLSIYVQMDAELTAVSISLPFKTSDSVFLERVQSAVDSGRLAFTENSMKENLW